MATTLRIGAVLSRVFERFAADAHGVAAVDFAVILPFLLIFYLSAFDGSQAVSANSKVEAIGYTVGDLVSRSTTMDATRLSNIMSLSSAILNPYSVDGLAVTVTAVRVDVNGKATVAWSKTNAAALPAAKPGDAYTLPTNVQSFSDTYLVVSSVAYLYKPLLSYGGVISDIAMGNTTVYRPRKSAEIPFT